MLSFTKGQNLVPNPSFEDTVNCPLIGCAQVSLCTAWFDPNLMSSDYFNSCSPIVGSCYVPNNFFGFQQAYEGNSYMGMALYWTSLPNYREYIATTLLETLKKDRHYCFSFQITLADSSCFALKDIYLGVYADTSGINKTILTPDTFYAMTNSIFIEKNSWTELSINFRAKGNEKYIAIGNFLNDSQTSAGPLLNGGNFISYDFAYYFIDKVSLTICAEEAFENQTPNVFTPNNDGINDLVYLVSNASTYFTIYVYNRWGIKVLESDLQTFWDGYTTSGQLCSDGIYYYIVEYKEGDSYKRKKGTLTLIR